MDKNGLCDAAINAMKNSYSPYSGFKVGAALLTDGGRVYTGCNIENSSYTPTVCAERTAIFKAVSDGEKSFKMMAVAGGKDGVINGEFPPCGVCRQVMAEFCRPDFKILLVKSRSSFKEYSLGELLPEAFTLKEE